MDIKKHVKNRGEDFVFITKPLVNAWWSRLNKQAFGGKLKKPDRTYIKCGKGTLGWCARNYLAINGEIDNRKLFIEVLFHEMVHQWQYQNNVPQGHGKSFKQWAPKAKRLGLRLNKAY